MLNFFKNLLRHIYYFLLQDLRACCHCGYIWGRVWLLCARCEDELRIAPKFVEFGGFRVFSPMSWKYEDKLIGSVIYGQKGGLDAEASNRLASIIVTARITLEKFPDRAVLVPMPSSRRGRRRDHALSLAQALGRQTGWPVMSLLVRPDTQEAQKGKRRDERRDLKIFSLELPPTLTGTIILVDDVVTTGSTAASCHRALGAPENMEVWALAYRELGF